MSTYDISDRVMEYIWPICIMHYREPHNRQDTAACWGEWRQRPLEFVYVVVYIDTVHYHVRSESQIVKKAVYIAIAIDLDWHKDVLGTWVRENESAKYCSSVLNSLKTET